MELGMQNNGKEFNQTLISKYIKVVAVVILYWVVSISMVFMNKQLLGGVEGGSKDAPIFITAVQCIVTVLCCLVLSGLSSTFPHYISFPKVGMVARDKARKIFPLSCIFVLMLVMNNLCLKYVGVAFYYVGRSLTTVFNVFFTFIILREKTSPPALVCCSIIVGGFWLGVDQEDAAGSLSVMGVIFGVVASAAVSLYAIFTKKVLPVVDGSVWELLYYNSFLAFFLLCPLVVVLGELNAVSQIFLQFDMHYIFLLLLSGVFGFAIGFVTGLQIQVTSPLTHNVSGTAKACFQTVMATWWYNDSKSFLWWSSNWIILAGSLAYTKVKQLQMAANHRNSQKL